MRSHLRSCALLLALLAESTAYAHETAVAVLGVGATAAPGAEPVAEAVTDSLRKAAGERRSIALVPAADLAEVKMVFGCTTSQPSCLAEAGRSLSADELIYGEVRRVGATQLGVSLKLLDVKSARVVRFVNDTLTRRELAGEQLGALAHGWLAQLVDVDLPPQAAPKVALPEVATEPPPAPLAIAPAAPTSEPLPTRRIGRGLVITGGVLLGAALVTAGVAIGTWRRQLDLEQQNQAQLVALMPPRPDSTAREFFTQPLCATPIPPSVWRYNSLGATQFSRRCDSASTLGDVSTAMWISTAVLATGGVLALVLGDRRATQERQQRSALRGLTLAPVFADRAGGLIAHLDF